MAVAFSKAWVASHAECSGATCPPKCAHASRGKNNDEATVRGTRFKAFEEKSRAIDRDRDKTNPTTIRSRYFNKTAPTQTIRTSVSRQTECFGANCRWPCC